ncbi:hypothetical protein ELH43_40210 [Rhizobium ruizarguesonis]|nr:hypothetical protein ELH43_40210 [Rhizobium ruizarguesonis]
MTDAEWAGFRSRRQGAQASFGRRERSSGTFYVLRGGIPWRLIPKTASQEYGVRLFVPLA